MFGQQLEMEETSAEDLFALTVKNIKDTHPNQVWIPDWLDNIQKQSKSCCGVRTYRDYQEFWPEFPTSLARSCCRVQGKSAESCPTELTKILYPHTAADYFKVESGCMNEINQATQRHIEESFYACILMSIMIGASFLAYLLLYVKRYLTSPAQEPRKKSRGKGVAASITYLPDLDMGSNQKQNINAASSNQFVSPIDSVDGPIVSVESIEPSPKLFSQAAPVPPKAENEVGIHGHKIVKVKPSITKINKANTVFAGILGGGSEASTGDDMTVGAGNLGRQEVFVAQDTSGSPASFPDTTGSFDDIGDVVVADQESASPNQGGGSPHQKKHRKLGMSRRRRQQQQNL
ncbi:unnamed protein product [Orchesella dallaii]|uniref:Uncharacterized protein n=1 Tax=Orchesella dallaii TaxID=48710 RepID=A0ABP1QMT8_9HEXA